MDLWIAIDFTGGGVNHPRATPTRKFKHVADAINTGEQRVERFTLVMWR